MCIRQNTYYYVVSVFVVVIPVGIGGGEGRQVRDVRQRRSQGQPEAHIQSHRGGQRRDHGSAERARQHRVDVSAVGRDGGGVGWQAAEDAHQRRVRLLHAGQRGRPQVHSVRGPGLLCGVHQRRGAGAYPESDQEAQGPRARPQGQGCQGPGPDHLGPALHTATARLVVVVLHRLIGLMFESRPYIS